MNIVGVGLSVLGYLFGAWFLLGLSENDSLNEYIGCLIFIYFICTLCAVLYVGVTHSWMELELIEERRVAQFIRERNERYLKAVTPFLNIYFLVSEVVLFVRHCARSEHD